MRYFLYLSYNGTRYNGWQVQPNAHSVQETLQDGLSKLLGHTAEVVGVGRTDTGVHAAYYVAHFDTDSLRPTVADDFCYHLNAILPRDIAVSGVRQVRADAHARFNALRREYEYVIESSKNPFAIETAWQYGVPLDLGAMNEAAGVLLGCEDFTSFSKLHSDNKTNICRLFRSEWRGEGSRLIYTVSADRFLRNMVRALVGTMVDVGREKISLEDFTKIIESKNRSDAGSSAPPQGLFLTGVEYPSELFLDL